MSSEYTDDISMVDTPLLSLPVELVDKILGLLGISDLKSLRLSCKAVEQLASRYVFNTCVLKPNVDSIKKMCQLYKNDRLNGHVRRVVYCVLDSWFDDSGDFSVSDDTSLASGIGRDLYLYDRLLEKKRDLALFRFKKIDSVEIQFVKFEEFRASYRLRDSIFFDEDDLDSMVDGHQTETDVIDFSHEWLDKLLSSIHKSRVVKRLKSPTIINLVNYPLHLTHDPNAKFKVVLKSLKELHLSINTMTEGIRQLDIDRARFIDHLCYAWLPHCAERLTTLTLHMTGYWGPCPSNDFEELRFPKLRHLTLWNYAFVYKSQFEWVLRHGKLESLSLIGCPIVVHMEVEHLSNDCACCRLFDPDRFDGTVTNTTMGTRIFRNSLRWAPWLKRIRSDLIYLKNFQMCGGHKLELSTDWAVDRMDKLAHELNLTFEDAGLQEDIVADMDYGDLNNIPTILLDDEIDSRWIEDPEMLEFDTVDGIPMVRPHVPYK
jgi:hypothetical protein